ncbi:succinate dehydrogenase assembly factor 2 [Piscinibacterium candidicorallinum]|jgi:antitoxin CptB|uniref:FAD assembly factor SdhE n=1 Tax=Piscinibacterium candidicorallinum TaxID=1793872 RepID=A0ABV7GZR6_9BURK
MTAVALQDHDLARLRWRARRGLLENDLIMSRFFDRFGGTLSTADAQGLERLLDLTDNDLLDLLLARKEPDSQLADAEVQSVLAKLRSA